MKSHTNRLAKLEAQEAPKGKKPYMCIYYVNDNNPSRAPGFDVTPRLARRGGVTRVMQPGEIVHFDTLEEVQAFGNRPDIDLTLIEIAYDDGQPVSTATNGDYSFTAGIDMSEI